MLRRKLAALHRRIVTLLHGAWAIPTVLMIRALRPWRVIRLGSLISGRIGHFTSDAGQQWACRRVNPGRFIDLYWLPKVTCNAFWREMVSRHFRVHAWVRPLDQWNRLLPGGARHHRPNSTTASRDVNGFLEQSPDMLPFRRDEDQWARSWLRGLGWRDGEPFVCLLVRDSAYLDSDPLHRSYAVTEDPVVGRGWRYHDYRDSDIATYVEAAEWLAAQGVWVLRMGRIMARPMPIRHSRVIDYAFHPEKSDFLDVWLFAHCDFCITTGSGPDMVSDIYRRPLLAVPLMPLNCLWSWSDAIHVSKRLVWGATGRPLSLRDYFDHGYGYATQYAQAGIDIHDLTPGEILAAVQERWQRIQGTWEETADDLDRQRRFWAILKAHPDFHRGHGWIHPQSRAGAAWLRQMGDEFLT